MRSTGLFLARVLRPAAAARRMFEHFFQRLRRTLREPHARSGPARGSGSRCTRASPAPTWHSCSAWYADAYADTEVPLMRLHNLIVRTERQLAA